MLSTLLPYYPKISHPQPLDSKFGGRGFWIVYSCDPEEFLQMVDGTQNTEREASLSCGVPPCATTLGFRVPLPPALGCAWPSQPPSTIGGPQPHVYQAAAVRPPQYPAVPGRPARGERAPSPSCCPTANPRAHGGKGLWQLQWRNQPMIPFQSLQEDVSWY